MRTAKLAIKRALAGQLTFRDVPDPDGDAGSFLMTVLPTRDQSLRFVAVLRAEGIVADAGGLYPIHMDDWGLHIYYNVASLVNKRSVSGISVWQLAENSASANVSYEKGTCPHLDDLVSRTVICCVASVLTEADVGDIIAAYQKVAAAVCR